jgi:hypothetical protein
VREQEDRDGDGRFEIVTVFKGDKAESDTNGDGKVDVIVEFDGERKVRQREDRNFDGRFDVVTSFDAQGRPARIEEDLDGDGKRFEQVTLFENGVKVRTERDSNGTASRT